MNYLLNKLFQVVMMVVFILVFVILMVVGVIIMNRTRKKGRTEEDEYYQDLNRFDAKNYLGFDDIVDDMIVMNKHRRFVGAIRCNGYDYYTASSTQQVAVERGYIEFLRTFTGPVTYRQHFVRMSMEHTTSMYAKRYEEIERELFHKVADRESIVERLNVVRGIDLVSEEALIKEVEKMQQEISNLEWRRMHMQEQIEFMDIVCDDYTLEPDIEQVYVFEWEFHPDQYNIEMSEEDIHKKAIEELAGIARSMISALGQANIIASRCSTAELIEIMYQQSHPLTAMEFKMPDVVNSPYFDYIITSNDHIRKEENAYKDAMLEEGVRLMQAFEDMEIDIESIVGKEAADEKTAEN